MLWSLNDTPEGGKKSYNFLFFRQVRLFPSKREKNTVSCQARVWLPTFSINAHRSNDVLTLAKHRRKIFFEKKKKGETEKKNHIHVARANASAHTEHTRARP